MKLFRIKLDFQSLNLVVRAWVFITATIEANGGLYHETKSVVTFESRKIEGRLMKRFVKNTFIYLSDYDSKRKFFLYTNAVIDSDPRQ